MKIYVIKQGDYPHYHIVATTVSHSNAKRIKRFLNKNGDTDVEIEEYEEFFMPKKNLYEVILCNKTGFLSCHIIMDLQSFKLWFNDIKSVHEYENHEIYVTSVLAYDEEKAKEIAKNKFNKFKNKSIDKT